MRNRMIALSLLCALAMAGCESPAAQNTASNEAAEEDTKSDDTAAEDTASEETEDEEYSLGEELTIGDDGKVSNGTISITMPKELAGTYLAYCYENDINIYDKECNEAGYGGFAFGVCLTDDYGEYGGMRTKIGELTDADGKVFHVLISYPSDVQWDYTKSDEMPASYEALYDGGRDIIGKTLESEKGGKYVDGAGTKGAELYGDYAKEITEKIKSAKDANELEAQDLSPVYYAMTQGDEPKDPMKDIGVAYADFNVDGVDEMVIGDIKSGEIYDIYASVDGKPAHVISGHWRDYYKVFGPILAEYVSEGAGVSVIHSYALNPNSTELNEQYSLKMDETDGAKDKWAVSYDKGETWEGMTEEEYKQRLSNIEEFPTEEKLTFKALGEF